MAFGTRMRPVNLAMGYAAPRHRAGDTQRIEEDDHMKRAIRIAREHLANGGGHHPPPDVLAALHEIVDGNGYVEAGNNITQWIIDLRKSGHVRHPDRSWTRHKITTGMRALTVGERLEALRQKSVTG